MNIRQATESRMMVVTDMQQHCLTASKASALALVPKSSVFYLSYAPFCCTRSNISPNLVKLYICNIHKYMYIHIYNVLAHIYLYIILDSVNIDHK